jgi:hypothetical protein
MENTLFKKEERKCCVCDKKLFGRSDKVFCDIHCKNNYHAQLRKNTKTATATTTKILNKNYVILCLLLGENCRRFKIKKLQLEKDGFNFQTISGFEKTNLGQKMKIYEFSWYYSTDDNIVVMRDNEQSPIAPFVYKRWEIHYKKLQTKN